MGLGQGAYYYYKTEEGKNYEETILDLKQYTLEQQVPIRWILCEKPRSCRLAALLQAGMPSSELTRCGCRLWSQMTRGSTPRLMGQRRATG